MKRRAHIGLLSVIVLLLITSKACHAVKADSSGYSFNRDQLVADLATKAFEQQRLAYQMAISRGWQLRGKKGLRVYQLVRLSQNLPIYYQTCNVNSAISQGVDLVRNTPPYNLNGASHIVGIWDAGDVRSTHQEFGLRVTLFDYAGNDSHATHVGGTIAASGVDASSLGMAPGVSIYSYDWNLDESEMADRAMSYLGESGKIYISNHSYGIACGWEIDDYSGNYGPHWFGVWGESEDRNFGRYGEGAPEYDSICYMAPYYLPFWAAGNDRNDNAPADGTTFYYYNLSWHSKEYDSASDPAGDGYADFDTILPSSTAKNIITVGSVSDAVLNGLREPSRAVVSSYSGWGPTDDGRIKPDIVCNGESLYSSIASSDNSYANYSGTSMATPSASGAAILLVEYYNDLFPAQAMLSSTLKGLMIHTADDIGNAGPDYSFGWGLVNAKTAADQITKQYDRPDSNFIVEGLLDEENVEDDYSFLWDGSSPIRATLCWTDPAGSEVTGIDNNTSCLVNDLDIRIITPDGTITYFPYVLNPVSPADDATTGDNTFDNIEQVYIPLPAGEGTYTVQVTHKGSLTNSQQQYSLITSGQSHEVVQLLDHFEWSGISPLQDVNIPFDVAITAKDIDGYTITDFNDIVGLNGWTGLDAYDVEIGDGTVSEEYPISVYYKRRRTQSIYLADEIGTSGMIEGLALYVNEVPGIIRNSWIIRMKHTALNEYALAQWDSTDWTVVYTNDEPLGNTGWQYYHFTQPFEYNGVSNLMIDFSFNNKDWSSVRGKVHRTDTQAIRSLGYSIDNSSGGVPTSWSGTLPGCYPFQWIPNVQLAIGDSKVSIGIEPNETSSFVDGIWAGQVTVLEEVSNMFLRADDGMGHIGDGNELDILPPSLPGLNTPAPNDGAFDVPINSVLSWTDTSASSCQSSYDVYFGTDNPPTSVLCADANDVTCDPTLSCSGTYYWQVVARNCYGTVPGPIWLFQTESQIGDFDFNCVINTEDLMIFANSWLQNQELTDIAPEYGDGIVDSRDFAVFAKNWLLELSEY